MAKLVLSRGAATLGSWFIENQRMVIGRAEGADVRLDDAAVSKQHAAIEPVGNDHILLDLGSSNGTFVNGERETRHLLKHGDVFRILDFEFRYVDHKSVVAVDGDRTMVFRTDEEPVSAAADGARAPTLGARSVEIRLPVGLLATTGAGGRQIILERALTGIGERGKHYAAIFRRPEGFFVARVTGQAPTVNGRTIGEGWQKLERGDVVAVGGEKLELRLP